MSTNIRIQIAAVMLIASIVLVNGAPQSLNGYESYDALSSPIPYGYGDYVTSTTKTHLNGYEAYDNIQQADNVPNGYEAYSSTEKPRPNGY